MAGSHPWIKLDVARPDLGSASWTTSLCPMWNPPATRGPWAQSRPQRTVAARQDFHGLPASRDSTSQAAPTSPKYPSRIAVHPATAACNTVPCPSSLTSSSDSMFSVWVWSARLSGSPDAASRGAWRPRALPHHTGRGEETLRLRLQGEGGLGLGTPPLCFRDEISYHSW